MKLPADKPRTLEPTSTRGRAGTAKADADSKFLQGRRLRPALKRTPAARELQATRQLGINHNQ